MTLPRFGNPVAGTILPHSAPVPAPGKFRVTATFGQIDSFHPAPGHNGVDVGDQQCGAPLLAMATGKISLVAWLGGPLGLKTVLVVRGIDAIHPDYEWAIAHCASVSVKVGQAVTIGQQIGILGKTGTTACHAHIGCKHLVNGAWVEIDSWPLLAQNQPPEYPRSLSFAPGKYTGHKFSAAGAITASKPYTLAKASSAPASQRSVIKGQPGFWFLITAGVWAGYWIADGPGIT